MSRTAAEHGVRLPLPLAPSGEKGRGEGGLLEAVRARHPGLHQSLARLDPWQLAAVFSTDRAALVRAQVGSGKTAVLVHKVLYLHLVVGLPLSSLAVLTFTNQAADEIRTRIESLVGDVAPSRGDLWLMGTFHGVARALLSRALPVEKLGYRPGFTILDDPGREALWERLAAEHKLAIPRRGLGRRMEEFALAAPPDGEAGAVLARLEELARAEKVRRNVMDFDDLLVHAAALLGGPVPSLPPRFVLVDEFQDCEPRELALLARLRGPETGFFAVGDPHQVIYGWRGSAPDLFDRAEKELGCAPLALPVSYRSTRTILEGAWALLGDQATGSDRPVGAREGGAKMIIRRHHDPFCEALYLAERIARLRAEGVPLREVAVLYRLRRQADTLRAVFCERGLPVVESARTTFRELPAVDWLSRVLRAGVNPEDSDGARRAMTDPAFGCLPARRWNDAVFARFELRRGLSGVAAVRAFLDEKRRPEGAPGIWLCDRILALRAWLATQPQGGLAGALFTYLDLAALLRPTTPAYLRHVEHARRLLAALEASCAAHGEPPSLGIPRAVDAIALGGLTGVEEEADPQVDAVRLMTLHASKGREFQQVFISGVNDGLIPLARAQAEAGGEAEERRLLYVGVTRAREQVELSYHTRPGEVRALPDPSPYLLSLPASLVEWTDAPAEAAAALPAVPVKTPAAAKSEAGAWPVGQPVRHPRYGRGVVVGNSRRAASSESNVAGYGGEIECDFGKLGRRSFSEQMCPLVALAGGAAD
ncbi:MAG: ATP-dependent helicase [Myxococcales bacterium]|nr:ATP-dependent helicase [Myxococcales bacterium]